MEMLLAAAHLSSVSLNYITASRKMWILSQLETEANSLWVPLFYNLNIISKFFSI